MFTFFHCYKPETWEAEVKAGLINKNSGVRFNQNSRNVLHGGFNEVAKKDGALWNIVKDNDFPLYIDRLQGGTFLINYPYDMKLIDEYRKLLGDKFFGFQMHEWVGNYRCDVEYKLKKNGLTDWTEKGITDLILKLYPNRDNNIYLEAMSAKEMEALGCPETIDEMTNHLRWMLKARMDYTGGDIMTCDSYGMALQMEMKHGVKRLMPEIGSQVIDTKLQIAYARGMARAYGRTFGSYYEPWGGETKPVTSCNFHREGLNEWGAKNGDTPYETVGGNGGSSRSRQRRMYLYSFFGGAEWISEEWGLANTFYDWHDFELTPYGKINKDFIDLTERYSDRGEAVAPIALVLPKEIEILTYQGLESNILLGYKTEGVFADKLIAARKILTKIFRDDSRFLGNETTTLINTELPDCVDVLHEDKFDPNRYEYLIDATSSPEFAKKYADKICPVEDVPMLLDKLLPCTVKGAASKQFTRREDGNYYMLLCNNSGVVRTVAKGDEFLPEATEILDITPKAGFNVKALEGDGKLIKTENGLKAEIPAGGWLLCLVAK